MIGNHPIAIPELSRSLIPASIVSSYLWLKGHDGSTATVPNSGNVLGNQTLTGTLGTFWSANAGAMTFNGTDNYIKNQTEAARTLARLDSGTGHVLLAFNFYWTDNTPSEEEMIFADSAGGDASERGWYLGITPSNLIRVAMKCGASAATGHGGLNVTNVPLSVWHHILVDINMLNKTVHYYVDGVKTGNDGDWSAVACSIDLVPAASLNAGHVSGFVIGAQSRLGATTFSFLNKPTTGSGVLLKNYFMLKLADDLSADMPAIAKDWSGVLHELPWGFYEI